MTRKDILAFYVEKRCVVNLNENLQLLMLFLYLGKQKKNSRAL